MNYQDELIKHSNAQAYKKYILRHFIDHDIFLMTYTFKNSFQGHVRLPADNVFKNLQRKLNHAAFSNPSRGPKRVSLLCIREKSHDCKVSSQRKEDHYHCFVMVPKRCRNRFYERAVLNINEIYYPQLNKNVPSLILSPKLYQIKIRPNPNNIDQSLCPPSILENYDLDVRELKEIEDVSRAYDYTVKNVTAFPVDYNLADLQKFNRRSPEMKTFIKVTDIDHFFQY